MVDKYHRDENHEDEEMTTDEIFWILTTLGLIILALIVGISFFR